MQSDSRAPRFTAMQVSNLVDSTIRIDAGEAAMRDGAIPSPALTSAQTVVPKRAWMIIS